MDKIINIYCDESCHLPSDHMASMVLGALCCFKSKVEDHKAQINEIKEKHGIPKHFEMKWSKISPAQLNFYLDIIDWFFDSPTLWFRGWIIPDKSILDHNSFSQTHDDWYYKMYFYLLRNLIDKKYGFHIYLDIKDTRSRMKLVKLQEVLQNANYDFDRNIVKKMQHVHSHQVDLLQVADILIGALSYKARGLKQSQAKLKIIELIKSRTGMSLEHNSLISDKKFNIYFWRPDNGI
jgi:hypothetical protein